MYNSTSAATVLQVAMTAAMLVFAVFLSGCASNRASQGPAHFGGSQRLAKITPPAPRPAVRGFTRRYSGRTIRHSRRSEQAQPEMTDEQRYAAIYGVPVHSDDRITTVPAYDRPAPRQVRLAPRRAAAAKRIVVTHGDTLYNLSGRYQISVAALQRANNLGHGNLRVGQELLIPAR